jgi:hypothetical protein
VQVVHLEEVALQKGAGVGQEGDGQERHLEQERHLGQE